MLNFDVVVPRLTEVKALGLSLLSMVNPSVESIFNKVLPIEIPVSAASDVAMMAPHEMFPLSFVSVYSSA